MHLPMGLSIENDPETIKQRITDPRGYADSDIPLLESFGILKSGSSPAELPLSPEDYRTFINWLQNGPAYPVPSVPLRILCFYRSNLKKSMEDFSTTNGNRLKQENLIKTIDEMLRGGDDDTDPIEMCASGGQVSPTTKDTCCSDLALRFTKVEEALTALLVKPTTAPSAPISFDLSGTLTAIQSTIQSAVDDLKGTVLVGMNSDIKDTLSEIRSMKTEIDNLKKICQPGAPPVPGPIPSAPPAQDAIDKAEEARKKLAEASEKAKQAKEELAKITADPDNHSAEELEAATDEADRAVAEVARLYEEAELLYDLAYPNSSSSSSSSSSAATGGPRPGTVIGANTSGSENFFALGGRRKLPAQNEGLLVGVNTAVKNLRRNVDAARRALKKRRDVTYMQKIAILEAKLDQLLQAHGNLEKAVKDKMPDDDCKEKARKLEIQAEELLKLIEENRVDAQELDFLVKDTTGWLKAFVNKLKTSVKDCERKLALCKPIGQTPQPTQDQYDSMKKLYDEAVKEIDRLNAEIQRLETKSGNNASETERERRILEDQLTDAKAKIKDLDERLTTMTKNWSDAELQKKQHEKIIQNTDVTLRSAIRQIIQMKIDMAALIDYIVHIPPNPDPNGSRYANLKAMYDAALGQIDKLADEVQRLEHERGDTSVTTEQKQIDLQNKLAAAEEQVREITRQCSGLRQQYYNADSKARYYEKLTQDAQAALRNASTTIIGLRQQMFVLNDLLDRAVQERNIAEAAATQLKQNYQSALDEIDRLAGEIQRLETAQGDKDVDTEREITRLNDELATAQAKVKQLTKELAEMTQKWMDSEAQVRILETDLNDAKATVKTLTEDLRKRTEEWTAERERAEKCVADVDNLTDKITTLQSELDSKTTNLGTKTFEAAQLEKELDELRVQLKDATDRLEKATRGMTGNAAELARAQQMLEEAQATVTENQKEIAQLRTDLIARSSNAGRAEQMYDALQRDMEKYKSITKAKIEEQDETIANMVAQISDKDGIIKALNAKLLLVKALLDTTKMNLAKEIALKQSILDERDALAAQLEGVTTELEELRKQLDDKIKEAEKLAEDLAECRAKQTTDEELKKKIEELSDQLAAAQAEIQAGEQRELQLVRERDAAQQRADDLSGQLSDARRDLDEAVEEIDRLNKLEESLRAKLANKEAELDTVNEKLLVAQEELREKTEAYKAELENLSEQLSESVEQIRSLKTERDTVKGQLQDLNEEIARLRPDAARAVSLQNEVTKLTEQLQNVTENYDKELEKNRLLDGQISAIKAGYVDQIRNLDAEVRGLTGENKMLKQKLEEINELITRYREALLSEQTSAREEISKRNQEIARLSKQVEQLSGYISIVEKNKARIAELEATVRALQEDLQDLTFEYDELKKKYNAVTRRNNKPPATNTTRRGPPACDRCQASGRTNRSSCAECDHLTRMSQGRQSFTQQFGTTRGHTKGGKRGKKGAKLRNFSRKVKPLK